MRNVVVILVCITSLISCDSRQIFDDYKTVSGGWHKDTILSFNIPHRDTLQRYNLFINIRNDNDYRYSNLFLICNMRFPNGKIITDTLEYEMAAPDGSWLGTGFSDLKESKLWYKENVRFVEVGKYNVTLGHLMRKNGSIEGDKVLEGITNVGFRIEKVENQ